MRNAELGTGDVEVNAQRAAATLDDGTHARDAHAENERHPRHAFVADDADLERPPFVDRGQQRYQAVKGKVDMTDWLSGFVEHLTELQFNRLELGQQPLLILLGDY